MNLDTDLTPFTKINSKWIINLNVKHKATKLLSDNITENLDNLGFDDNFLDITPKAWFMKERIDKLDFIKIKIFCSAKDRLTRWKNKSNAGGEIFTKKSM